MKQYFFSLFISIPVLISCSGCNNSSKVVNTTSQEPVRSTNIKDTLPPPFKTKSVKNYSKVIGWKDGALPVAPEGFTVTKFADGLEHPRWIYVAGNGDIFVAESNTVLKGVKKLGAKISRKIKTQKIGESANRITLFRDADKDGVPEQRFVFAENLNQPFGMLIIKDHFYVANTDSISK
jgi:glucose/arabinose dehydrogenase